MVSPAASFLGFSGAAGTPEIHLPNSATDQECDHARLRTYACRRPRAHLGLWAPNLIAHPRHNLRAGSLELRVVPLMR